MQNNQQRLFLLLILAVIIYFLYTKWVEYKNPAPITSIEQAVQGSQQGVGDGAVPMIGGNDQGKLRRKVEILLKLGFFNILRV